MELYSANDKLAAEKLPVIREILSWRHHDDGVKYYFIHQFMYGWVDADYIHGMTQRDAY